MEQTYLTGRSSKAPHYKVIACKVMARELYYAAYRSPAIVEIQLLEQQLHNVPDALREHVQRAIDETDESTEQYDAIILGYGLCSNGLAGVRSRKTKIIVPRAHDCTTLFLGSRERYRALFDSASGGIYWYTPGWLETCVMPGPERMALLKDHYIELYDEDNAQFLIDFEKQWISEYKNAYYIDWPTLKNEAYVDYSRACADALGWKFTVVDGDDSMFINMLKGNWDDRQFLIVEPGCEIVPSYDESTILRAQ